MPSSKLDRGKPISPAPQQRQRTFPWVSPARESVRVARRVVSSGKSDITPNQILASLPINELIVLERHAESIDIEAQSILQKANAPIEHVYFLHGGMASILREPSDGAAVEIAAIGPEGMIGALLILGEEQLTDRTVMQIAGPGVRIRAADLRQVLDSCPVLRATMMRYILALMTQIAQNSACHRVHTIEQRYARWLLTAQDTVEGGAFLLKQESLAELLGVRRQTISVTASEFAQAGMISYVRGQITIVDRGALEQGTCSCYKSLKLSYERVMGGGEAKRGGAKRPGRRPGGGKPD